MTADYYNLTKTNILTADPAHPGFSLLTGAGRSKGPELDIQGEIAPGLSVILAYANQDVRVTQANDGALGQRFPEIPRNLGSFWTTYEFQHESVKGLKIGGVTYQDGSPVFAYGGNYEGVSAMTAPFATVSAMTGALFDYPSTVDAFMSMPRHSPDQPPKLNWRAAQTIGARLMAEQATLQGFTFEQPEGMAYIRDFGIYTYYGRSSLDVGGGDGATVTFDGDTGALRWLSTAAGQHSGETGSHWLRALHFGDVFGSKVYRVFVCALGLMITMLSATRLAFLTVDERMALRRQPAPRAATGGRSNDPADRWNFGRSAHATGPCNRIDRRCWALAAC